MMKTISYISFLLIFISTLIPNSFYPWTSFWMESISLVGLLVLIIYILKKNNKLKVDIYSLGFFSAFIIIIFINLLLRVNVFTGDYYFGILYSTAFILSVLVGQNLTEKNIALIVFTVISLISAILAIVQWSQPGLDNLYIRNIPLDARPFANLGQPNHLSTILTIGLFCFFIISEKLSTITKLLVVIIFCFALALTQSRTGILQLVVASLLFFHFDKKNRMLYIASLFIYFLSFILITKLVDFTHIDSSRDLIQEGLKTTRIQHWISLFDSTKQLFGHGILSTAHVHLTEANNPAKEGTLTYAHNIFIDLILWFGLIPGFILTSLLIASCRPPLKESLDPSQNKIWTLFAIFFIHCLLEYPFAYLHLLIPAGIFLGISKNKINKSMLQISNKILYPVYLAIIIISGLIFIETIKISPKIESLRYLDMNFIEESKIHKDNYLFINQLNSYVMHRHGRPKENISASELADYNNAAYRFASAPLLFRAAIANKYYGNTKQSDYFLQKICQLNTDDICKHYIKSYENFFLNSAR